MNFLHLLIYLLFRKRVATACLKRRQARAQHTWVEMWCCPITGAVCMLHTKHWIAPLWVFIQIYYNSSIIQTEMIRGEFWLFTTQGQSFFATIHSATILLIFRYIGITHIKCINPLITFSSAPVSNWALVSLTRLRRIVLVQMVWWGARPMETLLS